MAPDPAMAAPPIQHQRNTARIGERTVISDGATPGAASAEQRAGAVWRELSTELWLVSHTHLQALV
jgi:hypothetical protein